MSDPADSRSWLPWRWPGWFCRVLLLMLVVLAVAAAFTVRAWCLSHVPDVAEPFDVNRFYPGDLPPKQNAFTHYKEASRTFVTVRNDWHKSPGPKATPRDWEFQHVFAEGLSALSETELEWLADHRAALDEWRRGTERSAAQAYTFQEVSGNTLLPVHQDARCFIAFARIEALRCEADGDLKGAWEWCRASVRFVRHLSSHGGLIERAIGASGHRLAAGGVARWAEHPAVTADELRAALIEIRTEYALHAPLSETLKGEYLFWRQAFLSPDWAKTDPFGVFVNMPAWEQRLSSLRRPVMWVVGEPEIALRLSRQILHNQLTEIDKPLGQRSKLVGTAVMLFDPDPDVTLQPGQLDPTRIEFSLKHSLIKQLRTKGAGATFSTKTVDDAVWNERARQAALEVLLAAQAYRRDTGEFPESLNQLVPQYLEAVPLDPCDRHGGRLRYRRDLPTNGVVWSVGIDGNDEGGVLNIDVKTVGSADVGFVLKSGEPK